MIISVSQSGSLSTFVPKDVKKFNEITEIILKEQYSLSRFKNNHRKKENFEYADTIGLDFDEGYSLEQAEKDFADYKHIIATTRSHQKEKNGVVSDRFRVLLFLSSPITDDKTFTATYLNLLLKYPKADKACKDSSRFFYPSRKIKSATKEGNLIDPIKPLIDADEIVATTQKLNQTVKELFRDKGELSKRTLTFLLHGAKPGTQHHEIYSAARDAHEQGYTLEWFIEQLDLVSTRSGYQSLNDAHAIATAEDAFSKDSKYDPRIKKNAFRLRPIKDLKHEKKELEWIVDKLLTRGGVSLMTADPKAGKSTLVRQLIRDILIGSKFLTRQCTQGIVQYYGLEEQVEVVNASFARLGISEHENLFVHVGDPLTENEIFKDFCEIILETRPLLAVVDTMFDLLEVESENSYKEVKASLRKVRKLARDSGTHILLIHHNSKPQADNKRRGNHAILGSQAIAGGVDTVIVLEVEGPNRLITTSGREIDNWYSQDLTFDKDVKTYRISGKQKKDDF